MRHLWTLLLIFPFIAGVARADEDRLVESRFMSLRSNEIHMRVGPGKMYPIIWTYVVRGIPVEVIARHHEWIQVRDKDGETGWIYSRLLSSVRTAITVYSNVLVHYHPDNNSGVVAKLMKHVVVLPTACRATWCRVSIPHEGDTVKGWVRKQYLWGVTPADLFEED